jgi:2-octaprenylphenol hydroxylase
MSTGNRRGVEGDAYAGRGSAGHASTGRASAGRFDFLIVGGGVVGAVMAGLLLARKLTAPGRVAVIDEAPPPTESVPAATSVESDWGLRVFALSRASQQVLDICGAWTGLNAQKRCAYERMCVWDAKGTLTFDCAALGEPNLGFIVEGRALQTECRRAAAAAGAVFMEATLREVVATDTQVQVRLDDGRELQSQLLIGADGADSTSRRLLGIETAGHAYHQDALVAHVRTAKPHRSTAWQRFLPTGPVAFLPLPDGRSSIVWSTTRAEAGRLRTLTAEAFGAEVTKASEGVLGVCELTTAVASFPLKLQYALDYVRPRAVLVGDAAHTVHPLAGQGLNLGLMDCACLADVLGGGDGAGGMGTAKARYATAGYSGEQRLLRRYERWRRSENLLAATAMDGLERLFANTHPLVGQLRSAGLNALGKMPFVKRQLIERAMGLSGDVPEFLFDRTR